MLKIQILPIGQFIFKEKVNLSLSLECSMHLCRVRVTYESNWYVFAKKLYNFCYHWFYDTTGRMIRMDNLCKYDYCFQCEAKIV